jgi:SET domain-containing protein
MIDKLYTTMDKEVGAFLNNEGSGLYQIQSACNHSCDPSAEITYPRSDFTMVMQALRDIKKGEEITISYIDECVRERSRHSRIKFLRELYLFTCECPKCDSQRNDPDVTSSEEEDEEEDGSGHEQDEEEEMQCDLSL